MNINILLIIVLVVVAGGALKGHRTGFIKEISGAVGLIFGLFFLTLIIIAARGYLEHDTTRSITAVISMICLGGIYKLIVFFLRTLQLVGKLPLIKEVDRFAGALLGGIEALFIVWMLMVALPMLDIPELSAYIDDAVSGDLILKFIAKNNIPYKILQWIIFRKAPVRI